MGDVIPIESLPKPLPLPIDNRWQTFSSPSFPATVVHSGDDWTFFIFKITIFKLEQPTWQIGKLTREAYCESDQSLDSDA